MRYKIFNLTFFLFLVANCSIGAQKSYGNLYHSEADAASEIEAAVEKATAEGKHVLLQVAATGASGATVSTILSKKMKN